MSGGSSKSEQPDNENASPMQEETRPRQRVSQFSENDTKLSFFHSLGFSPNGVYHLNDDEQIIYQCGQHIAQYNYENRSHKFVLKSSKIQKIWSFAVSKNGKFIALSEELPGEDFQLSVYSFRTATRIRSLELKGRSPVVSMEFSADSRYLVAASKEPDQSIYLFHLEKHRLVAHAQSKMPIRQVSINPHAWHQIGTTGPDICNVWRFAEKELKPMDPLGDDSTKYTFTCHSWFDDEKLLLGTEEGKILIISGSQVKRVIGETVDTQIHPNSAGIFSIRTIERGFVCGGDHGFYSVFERTFDQKYFSQYKKFQTVERRKILDMCVSKKEENVILMCENNEMLYFNLANVDILKLEENNFTLLPIGFHADVCTGADTCLQKSLICSVSNDSTLRIWNFVKREVEFFKEFSENIHSVALHPQGMMLLIGFRYKLCLYNILHDDLYKCCEWYFKSCKVVRFSHGGHLFAAASTTSILIINSYSFKTVSNLRGHMGMVRDLHWSSDDRTLASAGFEGAMYEWNIYDAEKPRMQDCIEKQASFHACAYDDETHILAGVGGTDGKVYCFTEEELRRVPVGVQLTSMCLSKASRTLFVGTIDGRVLLYNWPVDDVHFREYQAHTKPITTFVLSSDERFLFTLGGDGCLFMLDIEAVVDSRTIHKKEFEHLDKFEGITTVMRSRLLEHDNELRSVKERMLQVKSDTDRKVQQTLEEKNTTVEQQRKDYTRQIDRLKATVDNLKHTIKENETKSRNRIQDLEKKHLRASEEIDKLYKEALENERKKYNKMNIKKDEQISQYIDKLAVMQKDFEMERERMKQRFAHDKMNQIRAFNELGQQYEEATNSFKETLNQTGEDHKQQMDQMQNDLDDREVREQKALRQSRTKEALSKTEMDSMRKMIRSQQEKIDKLSSDYEQAQRTIEKNKEEQIALEEEIDTARETITLHEKTISDLKKQSKELEKLRFILSFKMNKMKQEINPKEEMIQEMREKLDDMEKELMDTQKQKEKVAQEAVSQKEKCESLSHLLTKTQRQLEVKSREYKLLVQEMSQLATQGDPKAINRKISNLVSSFGSSSKKGLESEKKQFSEFERQRDYMQQQIVDMKRTLGKKEVHMKKDVTRKTGENSVLVSEINTLRREAHEHKQKIAILEQKLRAAQKQDKSSTGEQRNSTRPSTRGTPSSGRRKSFGLSRVRTPDSTFSSKPTSRKSHRSMGKRPKSGRLVKGSTWSKDSMDRAQLQEVLGQMEKTQQAYNEQQEELQRLQDYVKSFKQAP